MALAPRARTATIAALLTALAAAGSALASGPPPTRDATGALPYAVFEGQRAQSDSVQLYVAPSGRRLRWAAVSYRATCGRSRVERPQLDDLGGIVIERGRRFIRRERFRAGGKSGRRVLSGRFHRGWNAATVRYETRFSDRDRARCSARLVFRVTRLARTAPVVVTPPAIPTPVIPTVDPATAVVTLPALPPVPAPPALPEPVVPEPLPIVEPQVPVTPTPEPEPSPSPEPSEPEPSPPAGRYVGTTETGHRIAFTLRAVGTPAEAIAAAAALTCGDAAGRVADLDVERAERGRLRANGKFDAAGRTADFDYDFDGEVTGSLARGRLRVDTASGERCRSGRVAFTAERTG